MAAKMTRWRHWPGSSTAINCLRQYSQLWAAPTKTMPPFSPPKAQQSAMQSEDIDQLRFQLLGEITPEEFLQTYWQQKPLLIRNALPGFQSPLDGNDLAGLACEEGVESRLIIEQVDATDEPKWQLRNGPFSETDFADLPQNNLSLLVQDVDKHYPPITKILELFRFVPDWRIDDIMISYAEPGGSVGAHTDQYDVFLLQTQGQRRWQWAAPADETLIEDCPLRILANFKAEQTEVLNPGDMLYLPPGWAHHGVAVDECMTWSFGFRAPSQADLLQDFSDSLAEQLQDNIRFTDAGRPSAAAAPARIDNQSIKRMKALLQQGIDQRLRDPEWLADWLGSMQTSPKAWLQPSPQAPLSDAEWLESLAFLSRHPYSRWAYTEQPRKLFVDGQAIDISANQWALAKYLANNLEFDAEQLASQIQQCDSAEPLLRQLYAQGSLLLESEDE